MFASTPFVRTHINMKRVLHSFTFCSSGTKNETKYPCPQNTKFANRPYKIVYPKLFASVLIPIDQNTHKIIISGYNV